MQPNQEKPLESGYYWIKITHTANWEIAQYDALRNEWIFVGSESTNFEPPPIVGEKISRKF